MESRGYAYYPMGTHVKLGHLYLYHGHLYGGMYHTANHLRRFGCNMMYGHWHDIQHMTATHMDGPKAAWSIGCLKDMRAESNPWLKNRKTNWAHAADIKIVKLESRIDTLQELLLKTQSDVVILQKKNAKKRKPRKK